MLSRRKLTFVFTTLVLGACRICAEGPTTFSMPASVLLFGTYNELRIVTPDRTEAITPPTEVGYNHGYFGYPGISPRGNLIAWEFATRFEDKRAHFALGVYSLAERQWKVYGDFDGTGDPMFSPDGSKIAFVARQQNKRDLLIFDVAKEVMTEAPYLDGTPQKNVVLSSWAPDGRRFAIEFQRADKTFVAVLDTNTGKVQSLGEGFNPAWSPNGNWIAYFDPSGAKCLVVHPDGTGTKLLRPFVKSGSPTGASALVVRFGRRIANNCS